MTQMSLIFTRGKKSLTYDFKISIAYSGDGEGEGSSGTLKFEEFNDHGDREYSLNTKGNKNEEIKQSIKGQVSRVIKLIEGELAKYKEL